nr:LodA/GoxA family CTQ-dependent oxidase [Acidobacteriota bacterium]
MAIVAVKIFPPIGIARLGNSPTELFIGPEIPGSKTPPPDGAYKDASCRIKRQAARFRIFGFDSAGTLVQEITKDDASITWTAQLANKKASWFRFDGTTQSAKLRNPTVADRGSLEIDPGPRTLDGPNQAAGFNTGLFLGKSVPLGEMRTDDANRLLVLGGFGSSGSVPPGRPLAQAINGDNYANNDTWHDDVSDGPITATVQLKGSATVLTAAPAWVICPPPDFSPPLDSVTTLYDALFERSGLPVPAQPSFTRDIYPILSRVLGLKRVNAQAASAHFSFAAAFPPTSSGRDAIFARLRDPQNSAAGGPADMPRLWGDNGGQDQTVTKTQYLMMKLWSQGTFINDWPGMPPPPPAAITPEGLTRAALEACVGGAMYPGIEASWMLRDKFAWSEPFRLDHSGLAAGDVTKQMAVPWQSDFFKCYAYSTGGTPVLGWWPAQRPDDVFPEGGGPAQPWIRGLATSHDLMAENWHKLGFVVDQGGQLVETERRPVCTNLFLVIDHSEFSQDEVAGRLTGGVPAKFEASLYVVAESFLPAELGVPHANPTPAELAGFAPAVAFRRADSTSVPDLSATPQQLLLEDAALPPLQRQRFTFVYNVEFASDAGFSAAGMPVETQAIAVTATQGVYSSSGSILLTHQPNPYMLDGPVSWLSTDLRVFQVTEGGAPFPGVPAIGADEAAASAFIKSVVEAFNAHGQAGHPFDGISTDEATSWLELSRSVNKKRVFNFAVARVRYRAKVHTADKVRVFFRLFTTAATGTDYNPSSSYRRTLSVTDPMALLGLQAGEVVTIPCFGVARVNSDLSLPGAVALSAQADDDFNVRQLQPAGADEFQAYYGCWLDFNQTTPRFPRHPMPLDGPWSSGLKSIQELIRGEHQCLVAEVFFKDDPIAGGATPASSDKLSQRNLAILQSDNPGSLATHTVQHTFQIKATGVARVSWGAGLAAPIAVMAPVQAPLEAVLAGGALSELRTRALEPLAAVTVARPEVPGPDELMIRWGTLPRATRMTVYMPDVDAAEVLQLAGLRYDTERLELVDAHTLRCLPADVTYLPLPQGRTRNISALLTLELPEGVRREQVFRLVVHQMTGRPRRLLGAFQITIPVSDKRVMLDREVRKLSVLRHIAAGIEIDDPWHPIFVRYLDQIAGRVRGFGGDPD